MLATGASAIEAITSLKKRSTKNMLALHVFNCGTRRRLEDAVKAYADVDIYIAALDEKLNDEAYITHQG